MEKKELIRDFVNAGRIAVVGVSRNQKKFGYIVFKELKSKGYDVVPVNPALDQIEEIKCYPTVNNIPGNLNYILTVVPPDKTFVFINSLARRDVKTVWMQSGSESQEAIEHCSSAGINTISNECILMYAKPQGFHKFHRFVAKLFGRAAL